MPKCAGMQLDEGLNYQFPSLIFICTEAFFFLNIVRTIMLSIKFTRKVDLDRRMESNMGHHLRRKTGQMMIALL